MLESAAVVVLEAGLYGGQLVCTAWRLADKIAGRHLQGALQQKRIDTGAMSHVTLRDERAGSCRWLRTDRQAVCAQRRSSPGLGVG